MKLRAIPQVPSAIDPQTRQFLAVLKENIELLAGQRGDTNPVVDLLGFEPAPASRLLLPAGAIWLFDAEAAPAGWLVGDGSLVSRVQFPELFAVVGTRHSAGDGTTTFGLPDLRGEFFRAIDLGRGVDSGRSIGSWQSGSPVVHDDNGTLASFNPSGLSQLSNGATGLADSWTGAFPEAYYQAPGSGVTTAANAGFVSMSRPRNLAFLACISTGQPG